MLEVGEVVVYLVLQQPAPGLGTLSDIILPNYALNFLLADEDSRPHMIMVLANAGLTAPGVFPHTALRSAKHGDFLPVLTPAHYYINKSNNHIVAIQIQNIS